MKKCKGNRRKWTYQMKREKRNKNRARQCTIRYILGLKLWAVCYRVVTTLSGSSALTEVKNGKGGVNYLGEWQQDLTMWAPVGSPASDGIHGLCCVQDRTRSLLPSLPPSLPLLGGDCEDTYWEKDHSSYTCRCTHTCSVSWRSFYCFLKGDLGKDVSLNKFGGFFGGGERGTRDRWVLTSGEWKQLWGPQGWDFCFWPQGETGEYWPHGVVARKSEGRGETE